MGTCFWNSGEKRFHVFQAVNDNHPEWDSNLGSTWIRKTARPPLPVILNLFTIKVCFFSRSKSRDPERRPAQLHHRVQRRHEHHKFGGKKIERDSSGERDEIYESFSRGRSSRNDYVIGTVVPRFALTCAVIPRFPAQDFASIRWEIF